jgi:hypothetical protein
MSLIFAHLDGTWLKNDISCMKKYLPLTEDNKKSSFVFSNGFIFKNYACSKNPGLFTTHKKEDITWTK